MKNLARNFLESIFINHDNNNGNNNNDDDDDSKNE